MKTATELLNDLQPKYAALYNQSGYVIAVSPKTLNQYKQELYEAETERFIVSSNPMATPPDIRMVTGSVVKSLYGMRVILHPDYDTPDIIKLDEMPEPLPFDEVMS